MILVSACLLGIECRYDGAAKPLRFFPEEIRGQAMLPVCPEELGGLPSPRPPADLEDLNGDAVLDGRARVLRADGSDVTAHFLRGARRVVELAATNGCHSACLKSGSPSCGVTRTHVAGRLAPGRGVAAAALLRAGIRLLELA